MSVSREVDIFKIIVCAICQVVGPNGISLKHIVGDGLLISVTCHYRFLVGSRANKTKTRFESWFEASFGSSKKTSSATTFQTSPENTTSKTRARKRACRRPSRKRKKRRAQHQGFVRPPKNDDHTNEYTPDPQNGKRPTDRLCRRVKNELWEYP